MSGNPYGSLDPDEGDLPLVPEPRFPDVGTAGALWRGLRKRCPRCGATGIFTSWFDMKETCPRCGLRFEKEAGGFLGAMVINYVVAFTVWVVMLTVVLALMLPVVPVISLIVASIGIFTAIPFWFYPRSTSIWAAVEFLILKTDPDYRAPVKRDPRARELE
ncbi:MAG: DUF983 domain-containing protein [Actinomycetota bacterium]